jgi:hypothetical protein
MADITDIVVSVDRPFIVRLDSWCHQQPTKPARSEAVKLLVEEALVLREAVIRQQARL